MKVDGQPSFVAETEPQEKGPSWAGHGYPDSEHPTVSHMVHPQRLSLINEPPTPPPPLGPRRDPAPSGERKRMLAPRGKVCPTFCPLAESLARKWLIAVPQA